VKNEQASGTALLIAASLALMHADPVYSDAVSASSAALATRVLEHYSSRSRFFINVLRGSWFRRLARLLERITVPGILRHYAMRKKCIAQVVREATEGGIGQVVILGAGFDSLGSDLHREFAHVRVWEIDHPATQKSKQLGLELIDQTRFQLVPADLSGSDLKEMLSNANGFRPDEMTIWIAEGLLMYFPEQIVSRILQQTCALSSPGSRFVFTFMKRDLGERIRFQNQTKLVDWWLRLRGEPFQWGIARDGLTEFIHPWRLSRVFDELDLRKLQSSAGDRPLAIGELVCLAET
jgi:methyltransferase (TIGR00027 family)